MAEQLPKRNIIIVAGIIVSVVLANIIGSHNQAVSEQQLIESFFPSGQYSLYKENDNKWVIYDNNGDEPGLLYTGKGRGYNGTVGVLVRTDTLGQIIGMDMVNHSEAPSYVDRITSNGFLKRARNYNIREIAYDKPLDAVSGLL